MAVTDPHVPFLHLKDVNGRFRAELLSAMEAVLDAGWYIRGQAGDAFEREYAAYCGTNHCVGTANGLDALVLILLAEQLLGRLSPGSEILVPANTYFATVLAVTLAGLTPRLVEPAESTFNLDPTGLEAAITPRTQGILAVHLYGRCAEMSALESLAFDRDLRLYEDAAQAHGAMLAGCRAGNLSRAAGFSFYPTKNLGAVGDGGAVTTNDAELAACVRALGNYGSAHKSEFAYQGRNSRLDELQAAVLSVKLPHLDIDNARRRQTANYYRSQIINPLVRLPSPPSDPASTVWHQFVVRVAARERFREHLAKLGVGTDVHYPIAPHQQLAYRGWNVQSFPVTEQLAREVVSLPISPTLTQEQVEHVVATVNSYRE